MSFQKTTIEICQEAFSKFSKNMGIYLVVKKIQNFIFSSMNGNQVLELPSMELKLRSTAIRFESFKAHTARVHPNTNLYPFLSCLSQVQLRATTSRGIQVQSLTASFIHTLYYPLVDIRYCELMRST